MFSLNLFISLYYSYISLMKSAFTATSCKLKSIALYTVGVALIYWQTLGASAKKVACFSGLPWELGAIIMAKDCLDDV